MYTKRKCGEMSPTWEPNASSGLSSESFVFSLSTHEPFTSAAVYWNQKPGHDAESIGNTAGRIEILIYSSVWSY
jgi:hypothetical protein